MLEDSSFRRPDDDKMSDKFLEPQMESKFVWENKDSKRMYESLDTSDKLEHHNHHKHKHHNMESTTRSFYDLNKSNDYSDIEISKGNVWKLVSRSNMISIKKLKIVSSTKSATVPVTQKATTRTTFFTTKAMTSSPVYITTKKNAITNEELYWFISTTRKRQDFVYTGKFNFKKAEICTTKRDNSPYDSYISSISKTSSSSIGYPSRFVNSPPMPFKFKIPTTTSFSTTQRSFFLVSSAFLLILAAINYYSKNKSRKLCVRQFCYSNVTIFINFLYFFY